MKKLLSLVAVICLYSSIAVGDSDSVPYRASRLLKDQNTSNQVCPEVCKNHGGWSGKWTRGGWDGSGQQFSGYCYCNCDCDMTPEQYYEQQEYKGKELRVFQGKMEKEIGIKDTSERVQGPYYRAKKGSIKNCYNVCANHGGWTKRTMNGACECNCECTMNEDDYDAQQLKKFTERIRKEIKK